MICDVHCKSLRESDRRREAGAGIEAEWQVRSALATGSFFMCSNDEDEALCVWF